MNPYEVLGVSETATNEEIRSAYLKLVKKYHPDKYQDNPLKNLADEKLKEINEAYDAITKQRSSGTYSANGGGSRGGRGAGNAGGYGSYSSGSYGSYSSGGSAYSGQYAAEFQRVRQCLGSQRLDEAASILNGIPLQNAEWHYLYGIICFRRGEYSYAYDHLSSAVSMDPTNVEYTQAFNMLNSRGSRGYHSNNSSSASDNVNTACNCCSSLLCADACCECMGGDLIRCC